MRLLCLLCVSWITLSSVFAQADAGSSKFAARDSLSIGTTQSDDEAACLKGLVWVPADFEVTLKQTPNAEYAAMIYFPSPHPDIEAANNTVSLEWHAAHDEAGQPTRAPAVIVVHESGKNMAVGRAVARGLRQCGVHAFLIHLPYYGERRASKPRPDAERLLPTMRQAISDVRRARDAVAVLPQVDTRMIAVQGTSLGGFVASTSAALDRKFQAVFLMLSGGDLFDIIQNGAKDSAKIREQLQQAGLSAEQIKELTWNIEPLRLAERLDADRTWLYSGIHDDVVPLRNAELLAKAAKLSPSHHIKMNANHYSGVILLPFVIRHVVDHLKVER